MTLIHKIACKGREELAFGDWVISSSDIYSGSIAKRQASGMRKCLGCR